jgi:hypothetical protein
MEKLLFRYHCYCINEIKILKKLFFILLWTDLEMAVSAGVSAGGPVRGAAAGQLGGRGGGQQQVLGIPGGVPPPAVRPLLLLLQVVQAARQVPHMVLPACPIETDIIA